MTSGRDSGLFDVNTCHRCIEYLVFGLFDCGVGEIDCISRIVLGISPEKGYFIKPALLELAAPNAAA